MSWRRGRDSNSRGRSGLGALALRSDSLLVLSSPCPCASSGWSPREDSNLHCRVRSPVVSCISLRGGGDQPWNRTAFSRASAERYDHTSSLVEWSRRRGSNPRLRLTRAPCLPQHFVDLVQARGFEPRSSGNRPEVLPVGRSLEGLAVGPGLEPRSLRVTGGRVTVATPYNAARNLAARRGLEPRSATSEAAVLPLGRSGNGRVGRTRTSTDLRPKQVGCPLPNDPRAWGERPESNRLERDRKARGAPFAFAHHRTGRR